MLLCMVENYYKNCNDTYNNKLHKMRAFTKKVTAAHIHTYMHACMHVKSSQITFLVKDTCSFL